MSLSKSLFHLLSFNSSLLSQIFLLKQILTSKIVSLQIAIFFKGYFLGYFL